MLLDDLIELFKRASEMTSPYPSKESLGRAISAIEGDQYFLDYLRGTLFLMGLPEWDEVKSGLQQASFVEAVKSAQTVYARLLDFQASGGSLNVSTEVPPR